MGMQAAKFVLLPGLLCDRRIFAAQIDRFPGSIAIDGFGPTSSLEAMAAEVLATVPGPIALLGHSMGARVALEMFRRAPERVEQIALISTGVHPVPPGEADKRHALLAIGRRDGAAALVDQWLPPMIAPSRRDDAALTGPLRAMCIDVGVDAFEAQITALLARPAPEALLPMIRCPVLIATGSDDRWSPPAQHHAIAATIPGAQATIIPGAGHMLPAEAPDALNRAIAAWLSQPVTP